MTFMANLFGRSPIRPMQEHMHAAAACAKQILPLFEQLVAGNADGVTRCREQIEKLEHEADRIKNEIRSHLPKRMFLAVERRDMLEILDSQDSIADVTQDIAELVEMRRMVVPDEISDVLLELARCAVEACGQAERVIDELENLVETGFRGREAARVDEMIEKLSDIESETDALEKRAKRLLFGIEERLGISAIFWYKIIDDVGEIADYAERVGNRLRLLTAN
jgi:hypothetical protein